MQLKLKRSQRDGGIVLKTAIFCLDARVAVTPGEQASINRYKLANQVIYNSEASKRHLERGDANLGQGVGGNLKAIASFAMAAMKLNITIASLQRGQHIECKSLDELLGAEEAIMEACRNLKVYLDTAATFDGREVLFNFDQQEPEVVVSAISPQPALAAPSPRASETVEYAEVQSLPEPSSPAVAYDADQPRTRTEFDEWMEAAGRFVREKPIQSGVIGFFVLILFVLIF